VRRPAFRSQGKVFAQTVHLAKISLVVRIVLERAIAHESGGMVESPTARREMAAAADTYRSNNAGCIESASALFSNPNACSSGGSVCLGSTSTAIRSRTALAYSARLRRCRLAVRPGIHVSRGSAVNFRFQPIGNLIVGRVVRAGNVSEAASHGCAASQ
jgi:hypothetical protein